MFETPRPVPGRLVPALAGSAVVALALPVFVAAGWPLRGWAPRGDALDRRRALRPASGARFRSARVTSPPQACAVSARASRALLIGIPLVAVTVADEARRAGRCDRLRARLLDRARCLARRVLRPGGAGVTKRFARPRDAALPRAAGGRARGRRVAATRRSSTRPPSGRCTSGSRSISARSTCRSTRRSPTCSSERSSRA